MHLQSNFLTGEINLTVGHDSLEPLSSWSRGCQEQFHPAPLAHKTLWLGALLCHQIWIGQGKISPSTLSFLPKALQAEEFNYLVSLGRRMQTSGVDVSMLHCNEGMRIQEHFTNKGQGTQYPVAVLKALLMTSHHLFTVDHQTAEHWQGITGNGSNQHCILVISWPESRKTSRRRYNKRMPMIKMKIMDSTYSGDFKPQDAIMQQQAKSPTAWCALHFGQCEKSTPQTRELIVVQRPNRMGHAYLGTRWLIH